MGTKPKKRRIVGGVDTHSQTHHAAIVLMNGRRLADAEFPATGDGYQHLLDWMRGFGRLHEVGVEGCGSYGAGLQRHLRSKDVKVIEVDRPDRRQRRAKGKSDPLDAYAAADAVLARRARTIPKACDAIVESIRALHTARAGAVKARTACGNEIYALILTAPEPLRAQLPRRGTARQARTCLTLDPVGDPADPTCGTALALHTLAQRWQHLTHEIDTLTRQLKTLVTRAAPTLIAQPGIGPETAAQLLATCGDNPDRLHSEAAFAALCGVSPVKAASGLTDRHRLNQGGDRQANRALHTIIVSRVNRHEPTRTYIKRRTSEGKNPREIRRCLKRTLARQIYKILTSPPPAPPPTPDLCHMPT